MALIAEQRNEGIDALRKLSAGGYSPASYEIGNCFYIGNLVERSQAKAVCKWREASSRGHILAKVNLIKYEWHYANHFERVLLIGKSAATLLWGTYLTMRNDGHDTRLIGNTDPSLKR